MAKLDPAALPIADLARLLTAAAGQQVTVEMVQADIDAGAPTNADGTVNVVHYAAWLVSKAADRRLEAGGRRLEAGDRRLEAGRPFDCSTVREAGRPNGSKVEPPERAPFGARHA